MMSTQNESFLFGAHPILNCDKINEDVCVHGVSLIVFPNWVRDFCVIHLIRTPDAYGVVQVDESSQHVMKQWRQCGVSSKCRKGPDGSGIYSASE